MTVPIQVPRLGYKYLAAMPYGMIVKMVHAGNGLVRDWDKSMLLPLFTTCNVEVKSPGTV
jgi:hypothetical protein